MEKKLCKSSTNKMLAGVCGGFAEYFGWDPTWVRLGWAVLALVGSTGLWAYILAAIIMPQGEY